jgi:putative FmdB family regulatory protein
MPQYSYKCSIPECAATTDHTSAMKDRDALVGKACPTCGDGTLKRVFTPYNVVNVGLGDII